MSPSVILAVVQFLEAIVPEVESLMSALDPNPSTSSLVSRAEAALTSITSAVSSVSTRSTNNQE